MEIDVLFIWVALVRGLRSRNEAAGTDIGSLSRCLTYSSVCIDILVYYACHCYLKFIHIHHCYW